MSPTPCPECGGPLVLVTRGGLYAECPSPLCRWTQTPSAERVIHAAVETYTAVIRAAVETYTANFEGRITPPEAQP